MNIILSTVGCLTLVAIGLFGLFLLFSALKGARRGKFTLGFTMLIVALGLWAYGSWNDSSVLEGSFLLGFIAALVIVFFVVLLVGPFKGSKKLPREKKATPPPAQPSKPTAREEVLQP